MAEEAFVRLVGVGLHDGCLDLAAGAAFEAERRARTDPGVGIHAGSRSDPDRAVEADKGSDFGAVGHHHGAMPHGDLIVDAGSIRCEQSGSHFAKST